MTEDYYDHREDMAGITAKDMAEDREGKTAQRTTVDSASNRPVSGRQGGREQRSRQRASAKPAASQERHRPLPTVRPAASRVERVPGRKILGSRSSSRGAGVSSLPSGYESRGYGQTASQTSRRRSSSGAGGMSGYERGSSTRSTSSRGRSSMGGGGGGDALAVVAGVAASARIPQV